MRIKTVLLLIVLSLLGSALLAQDEARWYYGWNPISGELFSYTADGETNVLLTDVGEIYYIERLNDQNAFGLFLTDDEENLYFLTPEEAHFLTPTSDVADFGFAPLLIGDDYALFTSTYRYGASLGMLADFSAGTVSALGDFEIYRGNWQAAFSEDGALLRFIRLDEGDPQEWSLVERTLATGEDRVIYSGEGFPYLIADDYGENWLVLENVTAGDTPKRQYVLISASGETEVIAESTRDNPMSAYLVDEYVVYSNANCESDCDVTIRSIAGGDERMLIGDGFFVPVAMLNDNRLLVIESDIEQLVLLSEDQPPQAIGGYDTRIGSQPLPELLSPDERFLLVLTEEGDEQGYGVYDLEQQQFAFRSPLEQFPIIMVYYDDGGFIVTQGFRIFNLYRTADERVIPLPEEAGRCVIVLDDGDVLCTITVEESERARGIYRYDPDEDTYTLLVEGGVIYMR